MVKCRKFFILALFLLPSCTINHGDYTVLSNKIVNTKDFDMGIIKRQRNIKGEDVAHIIIAIPTGAPKLSEALNNAFEKTDTDIMTDVTVKSWYWYIPYVYGQGGWSVSGDAVKTRHN